MVDSEIQRPESKQPIPAHAKKVFSGQIFDVYQWEQKLFDGTTAIFEKLKRPDTAIIFPVLPDGRILLLEQEQPGRMPFISATGGRIDAGEEVLAAAKRELLEESGYEAERFTLWDARHPAGKMDWVVFTFVAKGLKKVAELHPDPGEKITLNPVTFDELLELASSPDFYDKEVISQFLQAKFDPEKRAELKKLFDPNS